MKIEEIRTSFTVYVIAGNAARLDGLSEALGLAGYMVARFSELTAAFSEFFSNPPHMILLDGLEASFPLDKVIPQIRSQLPESHIFVVSPVEEREKAARYLDIGAYDLILTPVVSATELLRSVDHAAERDYLTYLNEGLMESQSQEPTVQTSLSVVASAPAEREMQTEVSDFQMTYTLKVFSCATSEECIKSFMYAAGQALGGCGVVYFKYIQNRRVLVASLGEQIENSAFQDVGMNLNDSVPGFRTIQLREPMRLEPLCEMIREVFSTDTFFIWPLETLGEMQGLLVFLSPEPEGSVLKPVADWKTLLEKAMTLQEAEKRLHVVSLKDVHTDLFHRQAFLGKLNEEISRSRRTRLPLSLLAITLDQYGQVASTIGTEEATLLLKAAARILEKHSRVNDIFGRTGVDEFGLLLPHTAKRGAMVKAERLRRIVEGADFSKMLQRFPHLTISIGVSEYPSLCRDGEELIQSADEALFQVRKMGNKTCVSQVPPGFEPDFPLQDEGV